MISKTIERHKRTDGVKGSVILTTLRVFGIPVYVVREYSGLAA